MSLSRTLRGLCVARITSLGLEWADGQLPAELAGELAEHAANLKAFLRAGGLEAMPGGDEWVQQIFAELYFPPSWRRRNAHLNAWAVIFFGIRRLLTGRHVLVGGPGGRVLTYGTIPLIWGMTVRSGDLPAFAEAVTLAVPFIHQSAFLMWWFFGLLEPATIEEVFRVHRLALLDVDAANFDAAAILWRQARARIAWNFQFERTAEPLIALLAPLAAKLARHPELWEALRALGLDLSEDAEGQNVTTKRLRT